MQIPRDDELCGQNKLSAGEVATCLLDSRTRGLILEKHWKSCQRSGAFHITYPGMAGHVDTFFDLAHLYSELVIDGCLLLQFLRSPVSFRIPHFLGGDAQDSEVRLLLLSREEFE
jgi:hypothetical protein